MKAWMMFTMAAVLVISVTTSGCAKSQSDRRTASQKMTERAQQETVTGKVRAIHVEQLSIQEKEGSNTVRVIQVSDLTKMDRIAIGDQVKAYCSEDGHASIVQRITE